VGLVPIRAKTILKLCGVLKREMMLWTRGAFVQAVVGLVCPSFTRSAEPVFPRETGCTRARVVVRNLWIRACQYPTVENRYIEVFAQKNGRSRL